VKLWNDDDDAGEDDDDAGEDDDDAGEVVTTWYLRTTNQR